MSHKCKLSLNTLRSRKCLGIGILELMLALSIIAVLIVLATRYYNTTRTQQQISQAVADIQAIVGAANSFIIGRPETGFTGIDLDDLYDAGLLPENIAQTSPNFLSAFQTDISITGIDDGTAVRVEFETGTVECESIKQRLGVDNNYNLNTSTCNNGTVRAIYSRFTTADTTAEPT